MQKNPNFIMVIVSQSQSSPVPWAPSCEQEPIFLANDGTHPENIILAKR